MNVFAVIALSDASLEAVGRAVTTTFPENYLEAGKMVWLVADPGTTVAVGTKLGIPTNAAVVGLLIVNFTSYYGRASANTWEWIKTKLEAAPAPAPIPSQK
jgi:hypothetical protein